MKESSQDFPQPRRIAGSGLQMADLATLCGRVLIALLFVAGAAQKAVDPDAAMALLSGRGLPEWLVWPALAFNAGAALALLGGVGTRPVAVALAFYCALTSVFHLVPGDGWQMSIFVKNWSIAGGCLVLAAHGPGRYALRP